MSNSGVDTRFRTTRLPRPSWYLFTVLCLLLATTAFLLVKLSERAVIVDGVPPYVNVARVDWRRGASRSTSLVVMRDHKYFVVNVDAGFLSLYSKCNYYQGVLPQDKFKELTTVVESPDFRKLPEAVHSSPSPHSARTWLVAYKPRSETKCLMVRDADVETSAPLQSLQQWFFVTQEWSVTDPSKSGTQKCSWEPLNSDNWCRDRR